MRGIVLLLLIGLAGCLNSACGDSPSRGALDEACRKDGSCDSGLICADDRCVPLAECETHADCPTGQYCDEDLLNCLEGCRFDDDCLAHEACIDHQCAARTTDQDGDGFNVEQDCNDTDPDAHPGAPERCNGQDDDCDGSADEGMSPPRATLQFGVCFGAKQTCAGENGWVEPDYTQIGGYEENELSCDGQDNDCDDSVDEDLSAPDADQQEGVCAGAKKVCAGPQGWIEPLYQQLPGYGQDSYQCDGLDNDCDGWVDQYSDQDQDGYFTGEVASCLEVHGPADRIDCDDDNPIYNRTCITYVNAAVAAPGDGTSWDNAFADLREALAVAKQGYQVWVAQGIYTPSSTGDREASFTAGHQVELYGGFQGTETERDQRDFRTYATVLSGDLNGDDQAGFVNYGDNSHHVVRWAALLDGFTIRGGSAGGTEPSGGGIFFERGGAPVIRNCIFENNRADANGGGMYAYWSSTPVVINCVFTNNHAEASGGGLGAYWSSSPTVINCVFYDNSAAEYGGGLWDEWSGYPLVINSTFAGNTAGIQGGGLHTERGSEAGIVNAVFYGNQPDQLTAGSASVNRTSYSCIDGGYLGTGILTLDASPFVSIDSNLRLADDSACLDRGDNDAVPEDITFDLDGNPRIVGDRVDPGAYEHP